jgi:hypothetical protein
VPGASPFEIASDYQSGGGVTVVDGGTAHGSVEAAVTFSNPSTIRSKLFVAFLELRIGSDDVSTGYQLNLQTKWNADVSWTTPYAYDTDIGLANPILAGPISIGVPPSSSVILKTRFLMYRGSIDSYIIGITGFGGYAS